MEIDAFYTLPMAHPFKLIYLSIFGPAFVAALIFLVKTWKSKSWLPTVALLFLLAAHTAYSIVAGRLILNDRWYAPTETAAPKPD